MNYSLKESDWKKFRSKISGWQENYMDRLCKEYIELLSQDSAPSERFWALEKRIYTDKKAKGVSCMLSRSSMCSCIADLLDEKAITVADLDEFSDELKAWVNEFMNEDTQ